jgi:hypothetical protein
VSPGDWFEGANIGNAYEIHFAKPPDPSTRKAIATAYETALNDTPIDANHPRAQWQWSGAWAMFLVGQRPGTKAHEALETMAEVAKAIHAVAPIVEVIFHNVREAGTHAWDKWSVKQQAVPSPAPAWPRFDFSLGFYGRKQKRVPAKPTPKIDRTFEATRDKVRNGLREAETKQAAAKATKQGKPALVPVKKAPDIKISSAHKKLLPKDANLYPVGERTFAWYCDCGEDHRLLAWVDGKKATKVKVPYCDAVDFKADGSRILFHANKLVSEIVLPAKKPAALIDYSRTFAPCGVGYGPDDSVLVLDMYALVLYRRDGKHFEEVAREEVAGSALHMYRSGTLAVVRTYDERVVVYDVTATSLTKRASFKSDAFTSYEVNGRIYLEDAATTTELVNV